MIFSWEHLGLAAIDPVTLRDWYVTVLGAEVIKELAAAPPAYLLRLPGGMMLEIYQGELATRLTAENSLRGWRHVALRVTNLEQARAELASHGVTWIGPIKPAGGGGRVLFFADPENNLLHLVERPAGFELP